MKVFEFYERPEPTIIMEYYSYGNIADAGELGEVTYISAFGQILAGLKHLHGKGIAHRDLKPENLLVELRPLFRIVISDFGLAKSVPDSALLSTFCGSLTYAAPEVFPHISHGHSYSVDVWSLGVIVLQWIYGIPETPNIPGGRPMSHIEPHFWSRWVDERSRRLCEWLYDQEDCLLLKILAGMIDVDPEGRWKADHCLQEGLDGKLFRRRKADDLVICIDDVDEIDVDGSEGKSPPAASPVAESQPDLEPTIILETFRRPRNS